MVGHSSIIKGYSIYNIESPEVFIRRDVNMDTESYCNFDISKDQSMDIGPTLEDSNKEFKFKKMKIFMLQVLDLWQKITEDVILLL